MEPELFKTLGEIAGIGGIALGVFLLLFREVIRKNIFPRLDPRDAYKLIRLIIVLVFLMGIAGVAAWRFAPQPPQPGEGFKSAFTFDHLGFELSASPQLRYGFSSLESDKTVTGQGVHIKTLRLDLTIRSRVGYPCCDAWVLLGPGPFGYDPGGNDSGYNPASITPNLNVAPVQVRFVVGNGAVASAPGSEQTLYATYNFDSGQQGGNIDNFKGAFGPPLSLPNGLYAQVFLWNGNPNVDLEIEKASLTVEGTKP